MGVVHIYIVRAFLAGLYLLEATRHRLEGPQCPLDHGKGHSLHQRRGGCRQGVIDIEPPVQLKGYRLAALAVDEIKAAALGSQTEVFRPHMAQRVQPIGNHRHPAVVG